MNFYNILDNYPPYRGIVENIGKTPISVAGVVESAQSHLIASLIKKTKVSGLVVTYSDMEARAMYSDMKFYTDKVLYFPSKEYVFYNIETAGHQNEHERLTVLNRLLREDYIVIASLDALLEYTVPKEVMEKSFVTFEIGKQFDIDKLCRDFVEMGYSRESIVEGRGQFAVRGGILDIFPPDRENPVRIEFFDDETDSIREFDVQTQRSLEKKDSAYIGCVRELIMDDGIREKLINKLELRIKREMGRKNTSEEYISVTEHDLELLREGSYFPSMDKYAALVYGKISSLTDYFDENALVFIIDPKRIFERGKSFEWEKGEVISELKERGILSSDKDELYVGFSAFMNQVSNKRLISLDTLSHAKVDIQYRHIETFTTKTTVSFHGKIDYLYDDLKIWQDKKARVVILTSSRGRGENLAGVLNDKGIRTKIISDNEDFYDDFINIRRGSLGKGFEYPEINFVLVSDREIFKSETSRKNRKIDNTNRIKSYNDISAGDYVVHASHGIGQYMGTQKMTVSGVTKDYLKIRYKGTDVLYVPIDQMGQLYKYVGDSDKKLKLNKLGTSEWNKTKQRVKKSTEDMAKKLIELYAQREKLKGYAFSSDTPWQREFEDTFPYSETEDQLRSIEEVKEDMEKQRPMDRLLCGDVGFGKTEIALRAAFKAVNDSKQVAYLCPTTILAMQHYETFLNRMENFPVKVQMLSRFRTAAQQKQILKQLKTGEIDVIIGTHRLLSKDVVFRDLGLLIIDEEQRFGVAHKERLKELKTNIDVLTMTATPIPRTLHMAMSGVRDMSVLAKPPENRYPVQTYVLEDNPAVILDAMRNELARGGQVFYLHNRVQGIFAKARWIKDNIPNARVAVGHGKMKEEELEDIMYDMVNGETDILVCTTIIETGLDIPNANTIIIEDADRMGLAQLYQLRGRVGRSNRAAYAYLTYKRDKILSEVASKRLRAVKEFTEFGSGFKIAMRDLEIRGAGNILGAEQHGHMETVGYDMYCKLLKESVDEARGIKNRENREISIDINVNAYLPESYIEDHNQRIDMYKRIAAIESEDDKFELEDELIDRYGDIPKTVQNIIEIAALKIKAKQTGVIEIAQKGEIMRFTFDEGILDAAMIMELDKKFPYQIKVVSGEKPAIDFNLKKKQAPVIDLINYLADEIKGLQTSQ